MSTEQPPSSESMLKARWDQFWALSWKIKGPVLGVVAFIALAAIGAATGEGGEDDETVQAQADVTETATAVPTEPAENEAQEPTATPEPTEMSTPTPEPTPTISAEAGFAAWTAIFWSVYGELFETDLADAIESDYYWIDSVDRVSYDPDANRITIDATVDFEGVYARDAQEWRDDTWDLYRSYSRDVWGGVVTGIEGEDMGMQADWPTWTPELFFNANTGRLSVNCGGDLLYRVQLRQATQSEFESECTFVN